MKLSRYFVCSFCPGPNKAKATQEVYKTHANGEEHSHAPACAACADKLCEGS